LIELMLVVAIIGLLAAIAIPKFANLVIKAKEAAVRGKMGTVRSALNIYYADNEGVYPFWGLRPADLALVPKYLDEFPQIAIPTLPGHKTPSANPIWSSIVDGVPTLQWYTIDPRGGLIYVNCTHTDSKGTVWSTQ
jgi:type II secretory pathway pseudopilin PulG